MTASRNLCIAVSMELTIGERISAARKRSKMSQETLGAKVGVHAMTIMRIEGGHTSPRIDQLKVIAEVLDLPFADLVL